jgi:flavin reductase (DIM6/NTAB) family NADH-FMN oxidoreductase RutF
MEGKAMGRPATRRMPRYRKKKYPLTKIRRLLEPGPVVLVSSSSKGRSNIMTMGWHMMMGFRPALFGCYIWTANHSFGLIRDSGECVINLPTLAQIDTVVGIGNCSGRSVDKFAHFGLTPVEADLVDAPLIKECYANFECKLEDDSQVGDYSLFIWRIVKAHVATSPKLPRTIHYRGEGEFMVSGSTISKRSAFKPQNL